MQLSTWVFCENVAFIFGSFDKNNFNCECCISNDLPNYKQILTIFQHLVINEKTSYIWFYILYTDYLQSLPTTVHSLNFSNYCLSYVATTQKTKKYEMVQNDYVMNFFYFHTCLYSILHHFILPLLIEKNLVELFTLPLLKINASKFK